jgi:hypothetical protein
MREGGLMSRKVIGLMLLLVPTSSLIAQDPVGSVHPGDRVRVTAPGMGVKKAVAVVRDVRSASLVLTLHRTRTLLTVPFDSMSTLQVSAGRLNHTVRGAVIGGLLGLGLGSVFVVGFSSCSDPYVCGHMSTGLIAGALGVMSLVGALDGAQRFGHPEAWRDVRLPARYPKPGLRVGPGARIGWSFSF